MNSNFFDRSTGPHVPVSVFTGHPAPVQPPIQFELMPAAHGGPVADHIDLTPAAPEMADMLHALYGSADRGAVVGSPVSSGERRFQDDLASIRSTGREGFEAELGAEHVPMPAFPPLEPDLPQAPSAPADHVAQPSSRTHVRRAASPEALPLGHEAQGTAAPESPKSRLKAKNRRAQQRYRQRVKTTAAEQAARVAVLEAESAAKDARIAQLEAENAGLRALLADRR